MENTTNNYRSDEYKYTSEYVDEQNSNITDVPSTAVQRWFTCTPHTSPTSSNRHQWHNEYLIHLKNMFFIVMNIIIQRYKLKYIPIEDIFNIFSMFIFETSSGYI
jgi:hypothetical protein